MEAKVGVGPGRSTRVARVIYIENQSALGQRGMTGCLRELALVRVGRGGRIREGERVRNQERE